MLFPAKQMAGSQQPIRSSLVAVHHLLKMSLVIYSKASLYGSSNPCCQQATRLELLDELLAAILFGSTQWHSQAFFLDGDESDRRAEPYLLRKHLYLESSQKGHVRAKLAGTMPIYEYVQKYKCYYSVCKCGWLLIDGDK